MDRERLLIRAGLSACLLIIFCVLLILIFFVELPTSAEITSATLLGALVGNLTSTLSYWFDSTEHDNNQKIKPENDSSNSISTFNS